MIEFDKVVAWLCVVSMGWALIFAALVGRQNRVLTATNASLALYVTERLDSLEDAQTRLEGLQRALLGTSGPVAMDSILRMADK